MERRSFWNGFDKRASAEHALSKGTSKAKDALSRLRTLLKGALVGGTGVALYNTANKANDRQAPTFQQR